MTQAILKAASHILAQSAPGDPDEFLEPDFAGMEPRPADPDLLQPPAGRH